MLFVDAYRGASSDLFRSALPAVASALYMICGSNSLVEVNTKAIMKGNYNR